MGILRKFFIFLDHAAFGLIDDAYSIIFDFATVNVNMDDFNKIKTNLYIIIGIFSLFKIALFLINSLIDPDKLNEKGKGLSSIFVRTVVMLILLVICPIIFNELFTMQHTIMKENIIPKLIIGQKIYSESDDEELKTNSNNIGSAAGGQMKSIILEALVPVNREAFEEDSSDDVIYYQPKDGVTCADSCASAINEYSKNQANGSLDISTLEKYINTQATVPTEDEGVNEKVYVYDYMILLTTAAGAFLSYMLFSFALDIAVRIFELIVLQVLSPIFIVTFIDPKSSSSGPFKKWLQAIGKSYLTLFLRIGVVCLMVLLISWINTSNTFDNLFNSQSSFLAKTALVIGLLIFIKNFPKWISSIFGIESSGFGGLNIGKKLAGAALVGGAIEKGLGKTKEGLKSAASKPIKRSIDNTKKRAGNLANRAVHAIGAAHGVQKSFDENKWKANNGYNQGEKMKLADRIKMQKAKANATLMAANAESLKVDSDFKKENDMRLFANLRDKYNEGVKAVNPNYASKRELKLAQENEKVQKRLSRAGMDADSMGTKKKNAVDVALTHDLYGQDISLDKVKHPLNYDQMMNSYTSMLGHKPISDYDMKLAAYARQLEGAVTINDAGAILDGNGDIIKNAIEAKQDAESYYEKQNPYFKTLIQTTTYESSIERQNEYESTQANIKEANEKYREALIQKQQFINSTPKPSDSNLLVKYNEQLKFFDDNITAQRKLFESYSETKKAFLNQFIKSGGAELNKVGDKYITYKEPNDDSATIQVNGRYINKYGEFIKTLDNNGKVCYEFKEKNMSDESDLITAKQNDKLSGGKYKGKLDNIKEMYSIESKKIEDKK